MLGLDGGSWNLLEPLMNQGIMPNLQKLVKKGSSGVLQSTIPPYTAPAWVSSTTGVNPGKHGVFGFTEKKNGVTTGNFVDSTHLRVARIWNYINNTGGTCGLINVPITYPVETVNGFMVPCFFTPLEKRDYTYPESIFREILEPHKYVINIRLSGKKIHSEEGIAQLVKNLKNMTERRFKVMEKLREIYNPDFLMVVFTSMDKLQHKFWKYLDNNEDLYKTELAARVRPLLLSVYQQIDEVIGKVMVQLDSNVSLYLISDHGFGPQKKFLFMNKWLAENGFLSIKVARLLMYRMQYRYFNKKEFFTRNLDVFKHPIYKSINYGKSFFIAGDQYEHGIYATRNYSNSNFYKKIADLIEKLSAMRESDSGKPIFEKVFQRDEIYEGEFKHIAPDIVLKLNDYSMNILRGFPRKNRIIAQCTGPDGCHRPEGIIAAYGKDVAVGGKVRASIMDLMPTILYNMGLQIPKNIDGVVRKEIFKKNFKDENDIAWCDPLKNLERTHGEENRYQKAEKEQIAAQLRDLGYFE